MNGAIALSALALVIAPSIASAALLTIDFEDLAAGTYGGFGGCPQHCDYASGALVTDGFVLDPGNVDWSPTASSLIGQYDIIPPLDSFNGPNNGTQYFAFNYFFDASRLNLYGASGQVFGVRQLDLAENVFVLLSVCFPNVAQQFNCGVTFVGYLESGATISKTVVLDAIGDGPGPLTDFETLTFDAEWERLTRFSIIPSHTFLNPGLDNLVIQTVPEPSTVALFGLGIIGLGWRRSRARPSAIQAL